MAKFCKYCGKSLEAGEVCACTSVSTTDVYNEPTQQEVQTDKLEKDNIFIDIINILKDPINYGNKLISDASIVKKSFLILLIMFATYCIQFIVVAKKLSIFEDSKGFGIVLIALLIFGIVILAVDAIIAAANFLLAKIFKEKIEYKKCFGIVAVANSPKCVSNLLVTILFMRTRDDYFYSLSDFTSKNLIFIIIMIVGILTANVFRIKLFDSNMNLKSTVKAYMPIMSILLTYILLFIVYLMFIRFV